MASPGDRVGASALAKVRDIVKLQLEKKSAQGKRIYWNNFGSAWQKLTAGRGRAKKLGRGFADELATLGAEEATELLVEKAGAIYGLIIVGSTAGETDEDSSAEEEQGPTPWPSPLGHGGGEAISVPFESTKGGKSQTPQPRSSLTGHDGEEGEWDTWTKKGAKGSAPASSSADAWADARRKGGGKPAPAASRTFPWERAHLEQQSQRKGEGKGSAPTSWAQRLKGSGKKSTQESMKGGGKGKGKPLPAPQPSWEKGWLVGEEWDADTIMEDELTQKDGIALVSRQFFLENYKSMQTHHGRAAAVLPPGKEWFNGRPREQSLVHLLENRSRVVDFTYAYDEDGREIWRPKRGLLVQLGDLEDVRQSSGQIYKFQTAQLEEVSLEFCRDLAPPRLWDDAGGDPRAYFEHAVAMAANMPGIAPRVSAVTNKGEAYAVTVKIPPQYTRAVLTNIDKQYVFARKTVRGEEKDTQNLPIWLPLKRRTELLAQIREAREQARQQAGEAFRGIAIRYRQGYQIGVRVIEEMWTTLRPRFLPKSMLPADEARDVVGRLHYWVYGLPPDLDRNAVSSDLFHSIGWATLPIRERARPNAHSADWLVAADAPPQRFWFSIEAGGQVSPVVIEEDPANRREKVLVPNVRREGGNIVHSHSGPRYFGNVFMEDGYDDVSLPDTENYEDQAGCAEGGAPGPADARMDEEESGGLEAYGRAATSVAKGTAKGIGKGKSKPCPEGMRAPLPPTPMVPPHVEDVGGAEAASVHADGTVHGQSRRASERASDQTQDLLRSIMQRMEEEKRERQEQMLQMQKEQEKRDERLAIFEQRMLAFQFETEQRCQALHNVQMEGFGVVAQHMAKGAAATGASAACEQQRDEEAGDERSSHSRGRKARRTKKGVRERSPRRSPEGNRRSRSEERRTRRQNSEDDC